MWPYSDCCCRQTVLPHWMEVGGGGPHILVCVRGIIFPAGNIPRYKLLFCPVLYQKSDLCIPRNDTAQPRSQFVHSCICERFIYSKDRSAYLAAGKQSDRNWEYINHSKKHECGNLKTEHYNSVLKIKRPCSFISGITYIGTRHLYWILTGPSFAVCMFCWERPVIISLYLVISFSITISR